MLSLINLLAYEFPIAWEIKRRPWKQSCKAIPERRQRSAKSSIDFYTDPFIEHQVSIAHLSEKFI